MNVDTYGGGSMTMTAPSTIADVTRPRPLDGKGSEQLDKLISLTTVSSGEGGRRPIILELADCDRRRVRRLASLGRRQPRHATATPPANGQPPSRAMGHPGPTTWTAMVDPAQCDRLDEELAEAREVTERYPTVAAPPRPAGSGSRPTCRASPPTT